jgi:hypothetical protein
MLRNLSSLKKLVCTRLETKFNTYACFNISVIEDEFPLISNTGVWPMGYLIAPFYGNLKHDQVYSSITRVTRDTVLPSSCNRLRRGNSHSSQ